MKPIRNKLLAKKLRRYEWQSKVYLLIGTVDIAGFLTNNSPLLSHLDPFQMSCTWLSSI